MLQPDGEVVAVCLDRFLGGAVCRDEALLHDVVVVWQHDVADAVVVHAGHSGCAFQGAALEIADEVGEADPVEQSVEVRFVERDGVGDPVAERRHHMSAVVGEPAGCVVGDEAAAGGEPVRCREVVERHDGCEPAREAGVGDGLVVGKCAGVEPTLGLDTSPLDREAVGVAAETGNEVEVGLPEVVGVAGCAGRFAEDDGVCCSRNQVSEFVLPPSIWWPAVETPHRKSAGNRRVNRISCRQRVTRYVRDDLAPPWHR